MLIPLYGPRAGNKFNLEVPDLLVCCSRLCQNQVLGEYVIHLLSKFTIATTNWFQDYHTWLWTEVFNVTSLVTVITKYVDTTVTNYDTKITPSTITNTSSFDAVTNKLVAPNYAPGPTRIINELNGTAFTSMGATFYVCYPIPPFFILALKNYVYPFF